jgi:pimeloyl-ACP methyl ester carboxylesterase
MPWVSTARGPVFYALSRPRASDPSPSGSRPVILIHGAGGAHLLWPGALRRVPEVQVFALDLPGHGRAAGLPCRSVSDYAAAVAEFVQALQLAPAVVVRHSMGGAVAQALALAYPQLVAGLVLVATAARMPVAPALLVQVERSFEDALGLIARTAWGEGARQAQIERGSAMLRVAGPSVLAADLAACAAFDTSQRLQALAAPCLVVAGDSDRVVAPSLTRQLAFGLPNCHYVQWSGVGHMVMLERPEATAQAVRAFLDELRDDGAGRHSLPAPSSAPV